MIEKKGKLQERGVCLYAAEKPVTINHLISDAGDQGEVYHVTYEGSDYALKWFCWHPEDVVGGQLHKTLKSFCLNQLDSVFIMPLFIVYESKTGNLGEQFGYLMKLIPSGYYEMTDFLRMDGDKQAVRFKSYNTMLVAGMKIASAMQKLHLHGYCLSEWSPESFLICPENGDILFHVSGSIRIDGDKGAAFSNYAYTAPEIVRSDYQIAPSRLTDYYSMAIILYRLFFIDHPMEGCAWEKYPLLTLDVEKQLYAINPVFHHNPTDLSNRPSDIYAPNAHNVEGKPNRWRQMPMQLRKLFIDVFTEGIDNPESRPTVNVWINTLASVRDRIVRSKDDYEQIVYFDIPESIPGGCLEMKTPYSSIALFPRKTIYEISVNGNTKKFMNPIAGVTYTAASKTMHLLNLTDTVWNYQAADSEQTVQIRKNEQCPLVLGAKIEFMKIGDHGIFGKVLSLEDHPENT